jgi:hypothetical protein
VTATLSLARSQEVQSSEQSAPDTDLFDTVSPELALIDPDLAKRARARLPSYGDEQLAERRSTTFQSDEPALRRRGDQTPLISPELALVDPVLAEWARTRLPDPPYLQSVRPSEPAHVRVQPAAVLPAEQVSTPTLPDNMQAAVPVSARLASLAAALVVLAATGFLAGSALPPQSGSAPIAFSVLAETAADGRPAAPSQAHATKSTSVSPRSAGAGKQATSTRTQPGLRTFGWVPVTGAAFYQVEFFRAGHRIFAGKTLQPRLTLSASWSYRGRRFRLEPGEYQWDVWPIYNSAKDSGRGKPVVQSRLTVTG